MGGFHFIGRVRLCGFWEEDVWRGFNLHELAMKARKTKPDERNG